MIELAHLKSVVLLSCVVFSTMKIVAVDAQQNCNCLLITECPDLLAILQNPNKSEQELQSLRDVQCGFQGRLPKVCCTSNECTTPDLKMGTCKDIYECPALLQLMNHPKPVPENIKKILRDSTCKGTGHVNVCCRNVEPEFPKEVTKPQNANLLLEDLLPEECGAVGDQDKIIGGNETGIDQYPWMALIEYTNKKNRRFLSCAASLISKRYLVTAGHCVVGEILEEIGKPINVRLGEFDKTSDPDCIPSAVGNDCNDKFVTIAIEKIITHPGYKPRTNSGKRNDIALLRIQSDAPNTFFISPVCLPKTDITANSNSENIIYLTVAGWGNTIKDRSSPSDRKLHLNLPFVTLNDCINKYAAKKIQTNIWDNQVCAGGEAGKDSCRGDSGGPLMFLDPKEERYNLIGVVSYGPVPCGREGVPGVYTHVYKYVDWIKGVIKP